MANSPSGGDVSVLDGTLSGSNNLIEDGSGGLADSITGDPLLGPLADNGGPTMTHALLPGSPAIDAGNNALAVDAAGSPLLTDQRDDGFARLTDGDNNGTDTVDIGAFEFGSGVLLGDVNLDGVVNFLDISPFIGVLSANAFQVEADINLDGDANFLDISPFIVVLSSGSSPQLAVAQLIVAPSETPQASDLTRVQLVASPSSPVVSPSDVNLNQVSAEVSEPSPQLSEQTSVQLIATPSIPTIPPIDIPPNQLSNEAPEPTQQASDQTSVQLVQSLSSPLLPPIDTFGTQLSAKSQVQNRDDSSDFRNQILVSNSEPTEKAYDRESEASSLLDAFPKPATANSSADLFDTQPELLEGLLDFELDEVFEGLLL